MGAGGVTAWQRLRYGTLVVSTVAATGTLWFAETRRTVEARDVIEIIEGVEERYRAAYSDVAHAEGVTTQQVARWITDPSGYTWSTYAGTTTVATVPYLIREGTTNYITTNVLQSAYTFNVPVAVSTGRFIWAGWDTLEVSGFGESPLHGVTVTPGDMLYAGKRSGIGYYTQNVSQIAGSTNWVALNHGPEDGWRMLYSVAASTNLPPWAWTLQDYNHGYWCPRNDYTCATNWQVPTVTGWVGVAGTMTLSDFDEDRLQDANAREVYTNAVAITRAKVGADAWAALDDVLLAIIPQYVDEIGTNATYSMHTVTGLFAQLSIGDGTNKFTATPAIGTNAATYGDVGRITREIHLDERYAILNALTCTVEVAEWNTDTNTAFEVVSTSNKTWQTFSDTGLSYTSVAALAYSPLPQLFVGGYYGPTDWEPSGEGGPPQDYSKAFWSSEGRTYQDFPIDTTGFAIENVAIGAGNDTKWEPRRTYDWRYHLYKGQRVQTRVDAGGTTFQQWHRIAQGYLSNLVFSDTPFDDEELTVVANQANYTINADLTGVTVRAHFYMRHTDTFTGVVDQVSDYTPDIVAGFDGIITSYPFAVTSAFIDPSIPYTNDAITPMNHFDIGPRWSVMFNDKFYTNALSGYTNYFFEARMHSDTNVCPLGAYYGTTQRRVNKGPLFLFWDFTRCEVPLP